MIEWEAGENRIFKISHIKKKVYFLESRWNYRRALINLTTPLSPHSKPVITGSVYELGNLEKFLHMHHYNSKLSQNYKKWWSIAFFIEMKEKDIFFKFGIENTRTNETNFERFYDRKISLVKSNLKSSKGSLMVEQKGSILKISESILYLSFINGKLNQSIMLGALPRNFSELIILKKEGVQTILNLKDFTDDSGIQSLINPPSTYIKNLGNIIEVEEIFLDPLDSNQISQTAKLIKEAVFKKKVHFFSIRRFTSVVQFKEKLS